MVSQIILPIALILALVLISDVVDGHGVCVDPQQEVHVTVTLSSTLDHGTQKCMLCTNFPCDDCPHCLNGGGKSTVMEAAKGVWRPFQPMNRSTRFRKDSGMCDDPYFGYKAHEKGGIYAYPCTPIMKIYKSGSKVKFVVDVTINHNRLFEFFICDAKKCNGDINEGCFRGGHCHQLMRVKNAECESQRSKECGPIDPKHKGRWYLPCRKGGHVGEHFMGGPYMEYQLPQGFSTEHATKVLIAAIVDTNL